MPIINLSPKIQYFSRIRCVSPAYVDFPSIPRSLRPQIVMDVGCRSGLLSHLAVEAGAIKVFAVGNMQSASNVAKVLEHGEKAEVFEPLTGSINQIKLPCGLKKVDIIVSEWMG